MSSIQSESFLSRRYTYLLRGLCMIMIVIGHTANEFPEILAQYHIGGILMCGRYATGIFLFLSGYGLTCSIRNKKINRNYVVRHMQNLLVPYIVFWLFYIVVDISVHNFHAAPICLYKEFIFLKMPYVDTWFFRTIVGIYIIYFLWARFRKRVAETGMAITVIVYVAILVGSGVGQWWWNTILCFPLGILFAVHTPSLRARDIRWVTLVALLFLFIISQKYIPNQFLKAIIPPLLCCLFFAFLSLKIRIHKEHRALTFIGKNSLYMYLMEAIPIDNIDSEAMGLPLYVICSIAATLVLTFLGKRMETFALKRLL